jgi:mannose-6-phosphate isomerase-like protein (cupin superfamily)
MTLKKRVLLVEDDEALADILCHNLETEQPLARGDVFIVPNGVPHSFTKVQGPFLYYVVKTTSPAGGTR